MSYQRANNFSYRELVFDGTVGESKLKEKSPAKPSENEENAGLLQRRRRDSNSRCPFGHTGFQDRLQSNVTDNPDRELRQNEIPVAAPVAAPTGPQSATIGDACRSSDELEYLIGKWPHLNRDLQRAILAIIGSAGQFEEG